MGVLGRVDGANICAGVEIPDHYIYLFYCSLKSFLLIFLLPFAFLISFLPFGFHRLEVVEMINNLYV